MDNQRERDKGTGKDKGYTPDSNNEENKNQEAGDQKQNPKWDQAQRRQQAGPRSYTESTDSENISNQNTEAASEQIENKADDPNDPKKIGDQISERQQTMDEKKSPRNQERDRRKD